jgi:hypothetical protein
MERYAKWAQDSENRLDVLMGRKARRGPLVLHDDARLGPVLALRDGPWKLIVSEKLVRGGRLEPIGLYNLNSNREERPAENLVEDPKQAERVAKMSKTLMDIFEKGFEPEIIYKQGKVNVGL